MELKQCLFLKVLYWVAQQKSMLSSGEHVFNATAVHGQESRCHFSLIYSTMGVSLVVSWLMILATLVATYYQGSHSIFQKCKTVLGLLRHISTMLYAGKHPLLNILGKQAITNNASPC